MKILLDMNLSPDWVKVLEQGGFDTVHWSEVGDIRAIDGEIMNWAQTNGNVVFTHDLDFGILLAVTRAKGPSVIQVRTQDVFPQILGERIGVRTIPSIHRSGHEGDTGVFCGSCGDQSVEEVDNVGELMLPQSAMDTSCRQTSLISTKIKKSMAKTPERTYHETTTLWKHRHARLRDRTRSVAIG